MFLKSSRKLIGLVLMSCVSFSLQAKQEPQFPTAHLAHPKAVIESWSLSGIADAETGESYGYFFIITKQQEKLWIDTEIIDLKTNEVLLARSSTGKITQQENRLNWKVESAFFNYNPVNESWVFGVLDKNKQGFNFRVDGLKPYSKETDAIKGKQGSQFYFHQSARMNGNFSLAKGEHFVTAKNAWIQHQWFDKKIDEVDSKQLLCRFKDDSGFYAVQYLRNNAVLLSVADWLMNDGSQLPVSQFGQIKSQGKNAWAINLSLPNLLLQFSSTKPLTYSVDQRVMNISAGSVKQKPQGFCLLTSLSK